MRRRRAGLFVGAMLAACGAGLARAFGGNRAGMSQIAIAADAQHVQLREPSVRQAMQRLQLPTWEGPGRGLTPKEWGMSQACRRMVRHNRMRGLGIGGAYLSP